MTRRKNFLHTFKTWRRDGGAGNYRVMIRLWWDWRRAWEREHANQDRVDE